MDNKEMIEILIKKLEEKEQGIESNLNTYNNLLNELTDDEEFKQKVSKLVRWHMQPLFYDKNLPFFQPQDMINEVEYKEVALLSLCDRLGRGNLDEDRIKEEKERIESFKAYFEK